MLSLSLMTVERVTGCEMRIAKGDVVRFSLQVKLERFCLFCLSICAPFCQNLKLAVLGINIFIDTSRERICKEIQHFIPCYLGSCSTELLECCSVHC